MMARLLRSQERMVAATSYETAADTLYAPEPLVAVGGAD
jgi:hypothetical protein